MVWGRFPGGPPPKLLLSTAYRHRSRNGYWRLAPGVTPGSASKCGAARPASIVTRSPCPRTLSVCPPSRRPAPPAWWHRNRRVLRISPSTVSTISTPCLAPPSGRSRPRVRPLRSAHTRCGLRSSSSVRAFTAYSPLSSNTVAVQEKPYCSVLGICHACLLGQRRATSPRCTWRGRQAPRVVDGDFVVLGRLVFKRHRPAAHRSVHGGASGTCRREPSRLLFQPAFDCSRMPAQIRLQM